MHPLTRTILSRLAATSGAPLPDGDPFIGPIRGLDRRRAPAIARGHGVRSEADDPRPARLAGHGMQLGAVWQPRSAE